MTRTQYCMRRTRLATAAVVSLLLAVGMGCTRPSNRDLALNAYSGIAVLYAVLVAATAVSAYMYRRFGKCNVSYAWGWHLLVFVAWNIVSVLASEQLEPSMGRGFQRWAGTFVESSFMALFALGPMTLVFANILAKVTVLLQRFRLYTMIPLVLTLGIALLFLEPLMRGDASSMIGIALLIVLLPLLPMVGGTVPPLLIVPIVVAITVALIITDVLLAQWLAVRPRPKSNPGAV